MRDIIRKNKKAGSEFMVILLGVTIFALIVIMLILINLQKDVKPIGEAAKKVMDAAQEGDDLVNYIDISAKHAVRDTEYMLASKGGKSESECGTFKEIPYWYVDGKLCLPKSYNSDFKIPGFKTGFLYCRLNHTYYRKRKSPF